MTPPLKDTVFVVPGDFYAKFDEAGEVTFAFTPSAGGAGYFGKPEAWDAETGLEPELEAFWQKIAEALSAAKGKLVVSWEE